MEFHKFLTVLVMLSALWRGVAASRIVANETKTGPVGEEISILVSISVIAILCLFPGTLVCTRGKKSRGGGHTKNTQGQNKGQKRGLKVYDGQRIPAGSIVVSQTKLKVLPGWNVSLLHFQEFFEIWVFRNAH